MTVPKISTEMRRKYQLLYLLATRKKCTSAILLKETGLPYPTITRQIKKLRTDFNMQIDFVRWKGLVGKIGYFEISDWGVLSKGHVVAFCKDLFGEEA